MGIILRQSFKGTVVGYLGAGLGALVTLLILPKYLKPQEIGLTRVLLDTAIFLSFFAQAGIPNVIVRYFPYFRDFDSQHKGFFWFITFIPLGTFLIISFIFLLFKNLFIDFFAKNSPLFTDYYYLIIPLAFFYMFGNIYESYSASLQRITVPKLIREVIVRILTVAIIILYVYANLPLSKFVILFVLVYAVFFILNIINIMFNTSLGTPILRFTHFEPAFYKSIFMFMLFMLVSGIGSNLVNKIDILMITSMTSLSDAGIYSIAFYVGTIIEIPARSSIQISLPFVAEAMKNNDYERVGDLYRKNTLNQWIVAGLALILIVINLDNIYKIMPNGSLFEKGKYVVLIISLTKFIDVITGINTYIIAYSRFYKYSLYLILFLGIITVLLNLVFIPQWGILGAAIATLIAIFLNNLIVVWIVKNKLGIHPFSKQNIGVTLLMIGCIGINYLLPTLSNTYFDAIVRSGVLSLVFVFIVYKFEFSPELSALIRKVLNIKEFINYLRGK